MAPVNRGCTPVGQCLAEITWLRSAYVRRGSSSPAQARSAGRLDGPDLVCGDDRARHPVRVAAVEHHNLLFLSRAWSGLAAGPGAPGAGHRPGAGWLRPAAPSAPDGLRPADRRYRRDDLGLAADRDPAATVPGGRCGTWLRHRCPASPDLAHLRRPGTRRPGQLHESPAAALAG